MNPQEFSAALSTVDMILFKLYRKFFELCAKIWSIVRITHLRLKFPQIQINYSSHVSGGCRITCANDSKMILQNVYIGANVAMKADSGGTLKIINSSVGSGSVIVAEDYIEINEYCELAEMVVIRDQNHRFGGGQLIRESGMETAPIILGRNVWVGAKATVLKGVEIGDNAVIGASAVVTKSIAANETAVGIPAKILAPKVDLIGTADTKPR